MSFLFGDKPDPPPPPPPPRPPNQLGAKQLSMARLRQGQFKMGGFRSLIKTPIGNSGAAGLTGIPRTTGANLSGKNG